VRPELAVASLGRNNEFGHPHSETISLLKRSAVPLMRTDLFGTITITSDGHGWRVVEPRLARREHPTQSDIDRIATALDDISSSRTSQTRKR
jgi:beta-lactamase superfamily II metal-dependent hydrolase